MAKASLEAHLWATLRSNLEAHLWATLGDAMKITIPDEIGQGLVAALDGLKHPDVRHLVREVRGNLDAKTTAAANALTADEWRAVLAAVDLALVAFGDNWTKETKAQLRAARPKVERLLQRQGLREKGDGRCQWKSLGPATS